MTRKTPRRSLPLVLLAAMLGIAESTSRSQLRRARALLRAQLHATGEERNDPGL